MKSTMRKVLVVGCHCDDIELGCGGTIHKMREEWEITALVLSSAGPGGSFPNLKTACTRAMAELKVRDLRFGTLPPRDFVLHRQSLHELLREQGKFDTVLIQEGDEHQDHRAAYDESLRVFRGDVALYAYPSPYSCPNPPPQTNYCILERGDLDAKLIAIEHYTMYRDRIYMNQSLIEARCRVAASRFNHRFAESFRLIQSLKL